MNYSDRTRIIGAWLQEDLQSYDVPANHTTDRAAKEMSAMVEDINSDIISGISADNLQTILAKMSKDIRKNNRSRAWPTIYNLTKAAKKCSASFEPDKIGSSQPFKFDSDNIAAKRMNAGEPVAESYVNGVAADRLLEKNLVTLSVIDSYRHGIEQQRMESYAVPEINDPDPALDNPF